jgi:hypothetical protein
VTDAPKVSVCVITYRHGELLAAAIESVLAQQADFSVEIVVADDASPDDTRRIAQRLAAHHPTMRVLATEVNLGAPRNLARAIDAARGEYIALLEGDDRWTAPDKLQRMVDLLEAQPQLAGAYHAVRWVDAAGAILRVGPHPAGPRTREDLLRDGSSVPMSAFVFRNRLPDPLPDAYFASRIMGDWQLSLAVAAMGPIGYLDEPMSEYLVASGATAFTSFSRVAGLRETLLVIDALGREAAASELPWLDSHRSVHLYELARALSAEGRHREAVAAGLLAARLPARASRLAWREKRLGLARVARAALVNGEPRTRRAALRLLFTPHRTLRR